MSGFMISKSIGVVNAYRKPILVATVLAMIIGISVSGKRAYSTTPKEATNVSAPASTEIGVLSEQIKQLVKGLEYSDKVARDFVKMVSGWKDAQGKPVLVVWKKKLAEAKEGYKQSNISKDWLPKVEESIAKEISQRIQKEISFNRKFFDLADVIRNRQAQCLGYLQLVYILGNSIGLSVKAINVVELTTGALPTGWGHIASIVSLTDGKTLMVDLVPGGFISTPFIIEQITL